MGWCVLSIVSGGWWCVVWCVFSRDACTTVGCTHAHTATPVLPLHPLHPTPHPTPGLPFLDKLRQSTGPLAQTISQRFTQQRTTVNVDAAPPEPQPSGPTMPPTPASVLQSAANQPGSTAQGTPIDWNPLVKELREPTHLPKPWSTLTVEQKRRAVLPMDVMSHMLVSTYLEVCWILVCWIFCTVWCVFLGGVLDFLYCGVCIWEVCWIFVCACILVVVCIYSINKSACVCDVSAI